MRRRRRATISELRAQHRELMDGALARELQAREQARSVRVLPRHKRAEALAGQRA